MADAAAARSLARPVPTPAAPPRHSSVVRATHWLTTLCFVFLFITGAEIVISHPRFYWGETGKYITHLTVVDDLKKFYTPSSYSWYAGV